MLYETELLWKIKIFNVSVSMGCACSPRSRIIYLNTSPCLSRSGSWCIYYFNTLLVLKTWVSLPVLTSLCSTLNIWQVAGHLSTGELNCSFHKRILSVVVGASALFSHHSNGLSIAGGIRKVNPVLWLLKKSPPHKHIRHINDWLMVNLSIHWEVYKPPS
jgi:hypothetical protein